MQKLDVGIKNGEGALAEKDPKAACDTLVGEKDLVN